MAAKRFRLKFTFWLDVSKSDEYDLAEQIENLKQERLFSQTIRDGIRLMCDLRAGRTDVLFALFPWLAAEFVPPSRGTWCIRQEIDELRHLIVSQQGRRVSRCTLLPGLQKTMANGFSSRPDEDDDMKLSSKASKNGSSAQNFLTSLITLQS